MLPGCGAAVLGGDHVGHLGITLAFGFAIVAMAYGIGPVSRRHLNPAASLAVFVAGRIRLSETLLYRAAEFTRALAGAAILLVLAGSNAHLGQNGWDPGYLGAYSLLSVLVFESIASALFTAVILGATSTAANTAFAGLAIGITLAAIHILGIQITGVSVNPARSFGLVIRVGGQAVEELWLFFAAPAIGAIIGGMIVRLRAS